MWPSTTIKQEFWLKLGGIVRLYARYAHTNFHMIPSSSLRERVSEYTWCPRIDNLLYIPTLQFTSHTLGFGLLLSAVHIREGTVER